jgi:hypothetical protein
MKYYFNVMYNQIINSKCSSIFSVLFVGCFENQFNLNCVSLLIELGSLLLETR